MSTLRQYFDTDFSYAFRIYFSYPSCSLISTGATLYDINAGIVFLSYYFEDRNVTPTEINQFLALIKQNNLPMNFSGNAVLPSPREAACAIHFENVNPLSIHYQLYGDPVWRDLFAIGRTQRIFLYLETAYSQATIGQLQQEAETRGQQLQIRDQTYMTLRQAQDPPQAFLSHDSRDKEAVARPIATNLQRKLCTVWYDEYSLPLGANLRESIGNGLRTCKKCILILSKNFLSNRGWGRREFDSIFTREILEDRNLVLPIWYGVTKEEIFAYSPSLLNVKGVNWSDLGEEEVCRQIYRAVNSAA